MEIKLIDIGEINPSKYNPRKISESELCGLQKSLEKFGFVEPLVINKRTRTLVGGHQRLKAAQLIGYSKVPCYEVDLTESEEKALNIALNSHTIQGKFDREILSTLLEEVKLDLPELTLDLNFNILEKDMQLIFDPDVDFSEADQDKKKFKFIECPHCKEVFEQGQSVVKDG